jgi:hypothetical protein
MKPRKASGSNIETRSIALIELKARDRATLEAMAGRYGAGGLIDFLEGIVMKEQRPTIVARFYDDPPENG